MLLKLWDKKKTVGKIYFAILFSNKTTWIKFPAMKTSCDTNFKVKN